jgi:hypothetical protein
MNAMGKAKPATRLEDGSGLRVDMTSRSAYRNGHSPA